MRVYQAGPLFSEAEKLWHQRLKQELSGAGHEVIWPGDLVSDADVAQWGCEAPKRIFAMDKAALEQSDMVVALLDGTQVDDGTAWEIGFAYAKGIPVIGIRTDLRQAGETGHSTVNAMIEGSCHIIVRDMAGAVAALAAFEHGQTF